LSVGFPNNRRTRKSRFGGREFLVAGYGWPTRRIGFEHLPLLTESLNFLRLLGKSLSLCLIHRPESLLAFSVPAQIFKQRGYSWESYS
jgi:hypothetical protein